MHQLWELFKKYFGSNVVSEGDRKIKMKVYRSLIKSDGSLHVRRSGNSKGIRAAVTILSSIGEQTFDKDILLSGNIFSLFDDVRKGIDELGVVDNITTTIIDNFLDEAKKIEIPKEALSIKADKGIEKLAFIRSNEIKSCPIGLDIVRE